MTIQAILDNMAKVMVGQEANARKLLAAYIAGGHVLFEGVPGVGKTAMAKTFAQTLNCTFQRIQFTPDLLPTDITGLSVYREPTGEFEFKPGPIFAHVVLADEINRASPKTQSALLEAMEEQQVSIDGVTRRLPQPFIVLATQNPVEQEGTFPLPEAQLDRFLVRILMGYVTSDEEMRMLDQALQGDADARGVGAVASPVEILELRRQRAEVFVQQSLRRYIVQLVRCTREHPHVALGASPRAAIGLTKLAQALALIDGRRYVVPDDIQFIAEEVLAHRLILTAEAELAGQTAVQVVRGCLEQVDVPVLRA